MSKSPSSPLGPFQDGQKQPLDLTDSKSRPSAGGKMRRPRCPQWIVYLKPDMCLRGTVGCHASVGMPCPLPEEIQMCDITSHFCLASLLWRPCLCVLVRTICMSVPSPTAPPIYLQGTAKRAQSEKKTQIHQWAFDSEPCIISRFISQL